MRNLTRFVRVILVLLLVANVSWQRHYATSFAQLGLSSETVSWVDARTMQFSRMWPTHQVRNIALYVCISTRKFLVLRSLSHTLLLCPNVIYNRDYDDLFDVPSFCFSHKCLNRFGRSHYLYAEFVLKTINSVTSTKIQPCRPTQGGKVAVCGTQKH